MNMRRGRTNLSAVLVLALLAVCQPAVAAAPKSVELQVWTIRATRSNTEISPKLKPLAKKLKETFNFTGYKLVKADAKSVDVAKTYNASLTGPFKASIKPTERTDGKIKLAVTVTKRVKDKDEKKLSTTISLKAGRFQLFGGWKLDKGDVLIVAVSAK